MFNNIIKTLPTLNVRLVLSSAKTNNSKFPNVFFGTAPMNIRTEKAQHFAKKWQFCVLQFYPKSLSIYVLSVE
jgi:hypothetical protein